MMRNGLSHFRLKQDNPSRTSGEFDSRKDLHSAKEFRKKYMGSILQVYFKYVSFTLQILEFQWKYALSDFPKKKYK